MPPPTNNNGPTIAECSKCGASNNNVPEEIKFSCNLTSFLLLLLMLSLLPSRAASTEQSNPSIRITIRFITNLWHKSRLSRECGRVDKMSEASQLRRSSWIGIRGGWRIVTVVGNEHIHITRVWLRDEPLDPTPFAGSSADVLALHF